MFIDRSIGVIIMRLKVALIKLQEIDIKKVISARKMKKMG